MVHVKYRVSFVLTAVALLRVLREVEAVAQELQQETIPSNVTMADYA